MLEIKGAWILGGSMDWIFEFSSSGPLLNNC